MRVAEVFMGLFRKVVTRLRRAGWTRRRLAVAALASVAAAAAVAVMVAGWLRPVPVLASMAAGTLSLALLWGMRRVQRQTRSLARQTTRVAERLESFQRQVVAAIEDERLDARDRHTALLATLRGVRDAVDQLAGAPGRVPSLPAPGRAPAGPTPAGGGAARPT